MNKKKRKNKGVYLKNSKQKEGIEEYAPPEDKGLKIQWIKFIDRYVSNGGNGMQAYLDVYCGLADENVARAAASRLLAKVNIRREINNKLDAQCVTEAAIISELWKISEERKEKNVYAAVKALEILARIRGLLVDTKKFEFSAENPAIVPPVVSPERAKELRKIIKGGTVIE